MQTKTRKQALLWPQKPHQKELQIPQHKVPMRPCASGRTQGCDQRAELDIVPEAPESRGPGYT